MVKRGTKANTVYKTDEGAKFLLDDNDPKLIKRKKVNKVMPPTIKSIKNKKENKQYIKRAFLRVRPIIGLVCSIYLPFRPLFKKLSVLGNQQFDKVFHP